MITKPSQFRKSKHMMTGTPEYRAWSNMIQRCHVKSNPGYKNYGGRGIFVCDEWRGDGRGWGFQAFYCHIGPRPSKKHSIDRIDNNRGYEPGNVRWTTQLIQHSNTRKNRYLTHNGETLHLREWARRTGLTHTTIAARIRRGLSIADVLLSDGMNRG